MGLLSSGTPLAWEDSGAYVEHVRRQGIEQLINIYDRVKDRTQDTLLWGDELEYLMVHCDATAPHRSHVTIRAEQVLDGLRAEMKQRLERIPEDQQPHGLSADGFTATWHPEFGRFMLEGTPALPYSLEARDLLGVEKDMMARRRQAEALLKPGEIILAMGNFPRLGCPDSFADPDLRGVLSSEASHSLFFPDQYINIHPRYQTLTRNIRLRRGEKIGISLPLFQDVHTQPISDQQILFPQYLPETPQLHADTILLDAMGFGMGCCCLQITIQARDIMEARHLHDQLAVLCPIMLALTASTPIYRGFLSDVDSRWNVISASVDDRTPEERRYIPKSRYASVSRYIAVDDQKQPELNDLNVPLNEECYQQLIAAGMDDALAKHFAWLFIRDPLVIYKELINQDPNLSSDHFENIQSTNWQTMRFKPPPAERHSIGWRVEFRPMEIQPTDFENAALSVFIVLLSRVILAQKLNFYMPISLVDVNMERAQQRDAVMQERFHFVEDSRRPLGQATITEMTINEIVNGNAASGFPGLIALIEQYLEADPGLGPETRHRFSEYFNLIRQRANGDLLTPASWMRRFVLHHPEYHRDSLVSPQITYDLVTELDRIAHQSQAMSSVQFCCHYGRRTPCMASCKAT